MPPVKKTLRICKKGHQYYKSTDCLTCPICEKERKPEAGFLSLLAAPARRALENHSIVTLKQLTKFTEDEISKLHGMGQTSLAILVTALKSARLAFKKKESGNGNLHAINTYIAGYPKEIQKLLEQIRALIKKEAPDAVEVMSYGIPSFRLNGKGVVYYAAFKNHIGLYPAPRGDEAFKKELSAYNGGKGTIQFTYKQPLPVALIKRIVKFRIHENVKRFEARKK